MESFDDKYTLTGKYLVATPMLSDGGVFDHSVIYICSHRRNGVMGLVINKRLDNVTFSDISMQLTEKNYRRLNDVVLYSGGPVEQVRGMVLHSTDYIKEGSILINQNVAVSSTMEVLTDIAFDQGPSEKLIALGYSFWQPQQLENELYENDWLVIDGNNDLLFRTKDEEKWQGAMDESRIKFDRFVYTTGRS
mgnify:CR=1 FL=1